MDFFDSVSSRHSIRAYKSTPVEEDKLNKILETANAAPSAGNLQAYEMVVVRDSATRQALVRAAWGQSFIAEAPVAIVFVANQRRSSAKYGDRGATLYCVQDATAAVCYAQLAATALGLATCWVGAFDTEAVAKCIGAGPTQIPVAVLPVGYAAETPYRTGRRNLKDIVHEERLA